MKITLVQPKLYWKDPVANRSNIEELLWQKEGETDLIILPEAFNTGFAPEAYDLAEPIKGTTMQWMNQIAKQFNSAICGSVFIKEHRKTYNKMLFIRPDEGYESYDKKHLFSLSDEITAITPGSYLLTTRYKEASLGFGICYDLRFPAWNRKVGLKSNVMIFSANWPSKRIAHWKALLQARAIENQCYVVGVNITGGEIGDIDYNGNSMVIAYDGTILFEANEQEQTKTLELDLIGLKEYREHYPFLNDADSFTID